VVSLVAERARTPVDRPQPRRARALDRLDHVVIGALVGLTLVSHPLAALLHRPYWLDEMWVATLRNAPLTRQLPLSSSTPVGWMLLLRLIPGGAGAPLRLVPLAFGVATVVVAFVLIRSLAWPSAAIARGAGAAAALAVAATPVVLVRNDLKQYTADSCCALVILVLATRVEGSRTRRRLRAFAVASVLCSLVSTTSAFVVLACLAALAIDAVQSHDRSARRDVIGVAATTGSAIGVYFAVVVLPHDNAALRAYWNDSYLPATAAHLLGEIGHRLGELGPMLGMPAVVFVGLVAFGCWHVKRLGHRVLAYAIPLLWVEMVAAGMVRRYPFLDQRTSHFLIVASVTVAGVGAWRLGELVRGRWGARGTVVTAAFVVMFAANCVPHLYQWTMPYEDVAEATTYVARHRAPNDVVVVTLASNYGFSASWPGAGVEYVRAPDLSEGFMTRARGVDGVVYARSVSEAETTSVLVHARRLARQRHATRIWFVRSHLHPDEFRSWDTSFRTLGLRPRSVHLPHETIWVVAVS
jgi:hypothetical protein